MDANKNGIPDDEEMEEGFGDAGDKEMKVGDKKKTRTGELEKTATGVKHTNTSYKDEGDEIASNAKSGKGVKSHAKALSAAEKKEQAPKLKQSPKSAKTWGMKDNEKFDNRDKEVDEGSYLGKKLTAEAKMCPICKKDPCKCGKGNTKKKTVKEADLGKHNNGKTTGFKAVAKAARIFFIIVLILFNILQFGINLIVN
jgi:hypothetical protein